MPDPRPLSSPHGRSGSLRGDVHAGRAHPERLGRSCRVSRSARFRQTAAKGAGMAPARQRLFAAFGKPEIGDRIVRRFGMPVHPHPQNVAGPFHLARSERTNLCTRPRCPHVVLTTFAPRRTGVTDVDPSRNVSAASIPEISSSGCAPVCMKRTTDFNGRSAHQSSMSPRAGAVCLRFGLVWRSASKLLRLLGYLGVKAWLTTRAAAPSVAVIRPEAPRISRGSLRLGTVRHGAFGQTDSADQVIQNIVGHRAAKDDCLRVEQVLDDCDGRGQGFDGPVQPALQAKCGLRPL